ncbi:MAG: hypothetical protein R6X20_03330 [Phycisphaerae bacterium]
MPGRKRMNLPGVASIVFVGVAGALVLNSSWPDAAVTVFVFVISMWATILCVGFGLVAAVVGVVAGTLDRDRERLTPLVGLVGALLLVTFWAASSPGYTQFFLFGGRYREIVAAVKDAGLPPGVERHFAVEDPWDPATLRPVGADETPSRGKGRGHVWASRTAGGEYRVAILVEDWGHAGIFGYLYWEGPPPRIHPDAYFDVEAPGPMNLVDKRVAARWWSVHYNLD